MARFQIRDGTFGLALYEAETASEALLDFWADRQRGAARTAVRTTDDGGAEMTVDGAEYRAVPVPVGDD